MRYHEEVRSFIIIAMLMTAGVGCTFDTSTSNSRRDGSAALPPIDADSLLLDADPPLPDGAALVDAEADAFVPGSTFCPNGVCEAGETASNCPVDCGSCDGICSTGCCNLTGSSMSCSGGDDCHMDCPAGVTCGADCNGGATCYADCTGTAECYSSCTGGSRCTFDCANHPDECFIDCTGSSNCLLNCTGATSTCRFESCDGTVVDCGNGWWACNQACP